jgi:hypothetical protein
MEQLMNAVSETQEIKTNEISTEMLQLAFERTYKGKVGKAHLLKMDEATEREIQFQKRKNGSYASDRLQNIFDGFCIAMQAINDSTISFSDLKS